MKNPNKQQLKVFEEYCEYYLSEKDGLTIWVDDNTKVDIKQEDLRNKLYELCEKYDLWADDSINLNFNIEQKLKENFKEKTNTTKNNDYLRKPTGQEIKAFDEYCKQNKNGLTLWFGGRIRIEIKPEDMNQKLYELCKKNNLWFNTPAEYSEHIVNKLKETYLQRYPAKVFEHNQLAKDLYNMISKANSKEELNRLIYHVSEASLDTYDKNNLMYYIAQNKNCEPEFVKAYKDNKDLDELARYGTGYNPQFSNNEEKREFYESMNVIDQALYRNVEIGEDKEHESKFQQRLHRRRDIDHENNFYARAIDHAIGRDIRFSEGYKIISQQHPELRAIYKNNRQFTECFGKVFNKASLGISWEELHTSTKQELLQDAIKKIADAYEKAPKEKHMHISINMDIDIEKLLSIDAGHSSRLNIDAEFSSEDGHNYEFNDLTLINNKEHNLPTQEINENYWFVATQNPNGTWNVQEYTGSKEDFQNCVNENYNAELEGKVIVSDHEFTEDLHSLINDTSNVKPDLKHYETYVSINNYLSNTCPDKDMTNEIKYIAQTYGDKFLEANKDEQIKILKETAKILNKEKGKEISYTDSTNDRKSKDNDFDER